MAVDVYSEHFVGMNSPSFSFSNDLQENEKTTNSIDGYNPCRFDHSLVDSSFDFAFNVDTTISFQSSTADELFSNGKILPTSVKKEVTKKVKQEIQVVPCLDPHSMTRFEPRKKSLKEFLEDSSEEEEEEPNLVVTKPFWKFRRSNSLNCDANQKKGLIGSWKILSRSGSTGKFLEKILEESEEKKPNNNMGFFRKFNRSNSLSSTQNFLGNVGINKGVNISLEVLRRSNSTSDSYFAKSDTKSFRRSNSTGSAPNHGRNKKLQQQEQFVGNAKLAQKGQIKNGKGYNFGDHYSKSVKINPVLNLPSPYISRVSVDLFGIGSLFCNGSVKDKNKKK